VTRRTGSVDWLVPIDDNMVFLEGWLNDSPGARAELVSAAGTRVGVSDRWRRFRRPDVEKALAESGSGGPGKAHGFACLVRVPGSPGQLSAAGTCLEVAANGGVTEHLLPPPLTDPSRGRKRMLDQLDLEVADRNFLAETVHPAMESLNRRVVAGAKVQNVIERGSAPTSPTVSVVIPLYRRLDFLVHQLAQFALDPDLAQAEIIYVLDSPELASELEEVSVHLHLLYGIPIRLVFLNQNCGFAAANNLGIEQARAPVVFLLNSDVFPDQPGWLSKMLEFHRSQPRIGALGPKLLYEDGALQHAGMYFERDIASGLWQNLHYFKGLPREFAPSNVARAVPAVTGACLMIARDLYESVGGLSTSYVHGDYEDSDLCLRLRERGFASWYTPQPQLFHLERQSYRSTSKPSAGGQAATAYNRWLHTEIWDDRIEAVMAEFEAVPGLGD
jgi:GT2 family glycosyltransferase